MLHQVHPAFGADLARVYRPPSSQWDGNRFQNPVPTASMEWQKVPDVLRRRSQASGAKRPGLAYRFVESNRQVLDQGDLHLNWLGHAAVLIRSRGRYFLTDPMLGPCASPFVGLGPKRFFPSPIAAADLPPIEAVILSHDHYDHLDYATIRQLRDRVQRFIVPLGVGAHLRRWGVPALRIRELDWDEQAEGSGYRITATPARHFSGRGLKRDQTLWASYVLELDGYKLYFAGDSGIFPGFADIGAAHGPFELALIPIGAYDPAWHDIHLNPEEGLEAFHQVRGGRLLPTHWGTFDLALHSWDDPMSRLLTHAGNTPLLTPQPGEWVALDTPRTDPSWWQAYRA